MQGACACYSTFEIMLPYAGIIRIRFMGMISAAVPRAPLQIFIMAGQTGHLYFSTSLTS